jgi:hypothetical protein
MSMSSALAIALTVTHEGDAIPNSIRATAPIESLAR